MSTKAKKKYYAVRHGKESNVIYESWAECETCTKGVSNASYKSFSSREDAEVWLDGKEENMGHVEQDIQLRTVPPSQGSNVPMVSVYVDGSYNPETNVCGYASYINDGIHQEVRYGHKLCECDGRNVEGEVAAVMDVISYLRKEHSNYNTILIYHDYNGIGGWGNPKDQKTCPEKGIVGRWDANKPYTKQYQEYVDSIRNSGVNIFFRHVDAHCGHEGNEIVDKLAKVACGINLSAKDQRFLEQYKDIQGFPAGVCEEQSVDCVDFDMA